ncbi:murein hydrolase activator EnvC family protein [Streptomyces sp. NPDC054796]
MTSETRHGAGTAAGARRRRAGPASGALAAVLLVAGAADTAVAAQTHPRAPGQAHALTHLGGWASPVAGGRVSQKYGIKGKWAAGHHTGIDLAVPRGTPVRSVGSGTVVFAGRSGAYGKAVTIRMHDGHYTLFAHLSRITVQRGQHVRAGTLIGRSGNSGRTTGPHLHFEVRAQRGYGSDVDPVAYLARKGVRLV